MYCFSSSDIQILLLIKYINHKQAIVFHPEKGKPAEEEKVIYYDITMFEQYNISILQYYNITKNTILQ